VKRDWALVVLLALAMSASVLNAAVPVSPQFGRDILPLLVAKCSMCHMTGQEGGRLALNPSSAFDSLVGVPSIQSSMLRVNPNQPN